MPSIDSRVVTLPDESESESASREKIPTTSIADSSANHPPQLSTQPSPNNNDTTSPSTPNLLPPSTFHLKPPPSPPKLSPRLTPTPKIFQTAHFGTTHINPTTYTLRITGLVTTPLTLTLRDLKTLLPSKTLTATHECYGSPLNPPPTQPLYRIANLTWTGVCLSDILALAGPLHPTASHIWASAPDRGVFGGVRAECYEKDLPLSKALAPEVMLAWGLNGEPLGPEHGGPLRLVVPGWFGTNSVKWVKEVRVEGGRGRGVFTTCFYNEPDPEGPEGGWRPVWGVQVNSMVVRPGAGEVVSAVGEGVRVEGWAWGCEAVGRVDVSLDGGVSWGVAELEERVGFGWQGFSIVLQLGVGRHTVTARATSRDGAVQPLSGTRNHCHSVEFEVVGA